MAVYYFSEAYSKGMHAGNKARNDVEAILYKKYKRLTPYGKKSQNKLLKSFKLMRTALSAKKSDVIIMQYPLQRGCNWLVKNITKKRKCVLIIHDLDALRYPSVPSDEVEKLKNAYRIISHNEKMTKFLIEKGIAKEKIQNLGVFDYLIPDEPVATHADDKEICYAGNLAKSEFIYNIPKKVTDLGVKVYGVNYIEGKNNELIYCGSFDSEVIHKKIEAKFGLIWDGTSAETCNGPFGEYMKYNSPHKISMYIAAAMPVIIWKQAALADFVEKYNIGFTVESLDEIAEICSGIDADNYNTYIKNITGLREKVIYGKMLEKALEKAIEM